MLNKVMLIGLLGQEPELSYTPSGAAKVQLSVATTEKWTDKEGEKQEKTEWHRVIFWGRKAEVISEYFRKGNGIYIEGKLQTRSWEDDDGNKRYITEVNGFQFAFLPGKKGGGEPVSQASDPQQDIPF